MEAVRLYCGVRYAFLKLRDLIVEGESRTHVRPREGEEK